MNSGRIAAAAMAALALTLATRVGGVVVEQPRPFGHFLGDILTQRILLDDDAANDPPHPPPADRVGTWFERRPVRVEAAADGRRWLTIDYQIVNAPDVLSNVTLPGFKVAMKDGTVRPVVDWPVTLGPMTPAGTAGADPGLQDDRPIPSLPTAGTRLRLEICAALFASILAAWALWLIWRNRRDAATLPFARAWRTLQRRGAEAQAADGWIAVHRALNATAGRVIHAGSLPGFLTERPALESLRSDLEEFYRQSDQRFFAAAPAHCPLSLLDLCRKLRRLEQRGALHS